MRKFIAFLKKSKKAFTLMECVCAIAVVGLLSSVILPLTVSAIRSMRTSDAIRNSAATASANNATTATDKNKTDMTKYDNGVHTMYVTIVYTDPDHPNTKLMNAESAFLFTYNQSTDSKLNVKVTYYDLKNGMEEEDAG